MMNSVVRTYENCGIIFDKQNPLRVFEAFCGYGSQSMALARLAKEFPKFHFNVVGISDIDKYALQAYYATHDNDIKNYGDISKIDWAEVPDFDLFTYSFPCTDISQAGQQKGLTEGSGTTSSLLWECRRAIETKRPKYLLMENVKALTTKKFMPDFHKWLDWLSSQGYKTFWDVLNAKDYGVPQNRERVFAVSILDKNATFEFPEKMPLTKCLADVLEDEVDESYYLKDEYVDRILSQMQDEQKNKLGLCEKSGMQDTKKKKLLDKLGIHGDVDVEFYEKVDRDEIQEDNSDT